MGPALCPQPLRSPGQVASGWSFPWTRGTTSSCLRCQSSCRPPMLPHTPGPVPAPLGSPGFSLLRLKRSPPADSGTPSLPDLSGNSLKVAGGCLALVS